MRTIRVTGKGQIKVRPDTTRITMTLEGVRRDYGEALRRSAEETEALREILSGFGFKKNDLKTLSFGVDTEYESRREHGEYKQHFAGYRFRHRMKAEFPSDNERLGRILYALANGSVRPELRLSYTVSDPESAKNALLGKAVADAAEKAAVLTRSGGAALGDIQSIDYSWGEIEFECAPMGLDFVTNKCAAPTADSYALDIEPDDMEVSDTVTVVWELV